MFIRRIRYNKRLRRRRRPFSSYDNIIIPTRGGAFMCVHHTVHAAHGPSHLHPSPFAFRFKSLWRSRIRLTAYLPRTNGICYIENDLVPRRPYAACVLRVCTYYMRDVHKTRSPPCEIVEMVLCKNISGPFATHRLVLLSVGVLSESAYAQTFVRISRRNNHLFVFPNPQLQYVFRRKNKQHWRINTRWQLQTVMRLNDEVFFFLFLN